MASAEELAQLIEKTVKAVIEGLQSNPFGGARGGSRRILEAKGVSRVDTFGGKEAQWREWAFQFKVAVKAMDASVAEILSKTEVDEDAHKLEDLELEYGSLEVGKAAGELYDLLCLCLKGDPLVLVQRVTSMNGFEAWGRLYRRHNPVTPARALQAMIAVMVPPKVKDVKELPNEIEKWESKVLNLKREYNESLSERMKVAAITSMCPHDVQDLIFQQGDKLDNYMRIREQIKVIILNRSSRVGGAVPMDIGLTSEDSNEDWPEEEWYVDAVSGQAQCHKCGGFGHFARECPSKGKGKGKGKASEGKGKAKGKGKDKGQGKGGIVCWTCQKVGHRSAECPLNKNVSNVEEEEVKKEVENLQASVEVDSGGVFWINAVENECRPCEEFQPPKKTVRMDNFWVRRQPLEAEPVRLSNRFGCFAVSEEEKEAHEATVERLQRKSLERNILAMGSDFGTKRGEGIRGQIVIDSGAVDSVLPRYELDQAFELLPKKENMRFVAANGSPINNYGRRRVVFRAAGRKGINCMSFHVTDSKKALASVAKMVEQGNSVHFTPKGSYIEGPNGEQIPLKVERGLYVMDVNYLPGFRGQV